MQPYYKTYTKFYISVDCIIFGFTDGALKLLIQERPFEPGKGLQSLIGGFVEADENIDDAAKRVLAEYTGLEKIYMRQLGAFGDVKRDPGERVISVVYYALINVDEYKNISNRNAHWGDIEELPLLCFDHNHMVEKARIKLKDDLADEPIGMNLLPKYFTLTQLQTLHECILGCSIDKRNFRRKLTEQGYVVKTNMIDKKTSRRGASLYKFDVKE